MESVLGHSDTSSTNKFYHVSYFHSKSKIFVRGIFKFYSTTVHSNRCSNRCSHGINISTFRYRQYYTEIDSMLNVQGTILLCTLFLV